MIAGLISLLSAQVQTSDEIRFWSALYGVDPTLARAVTYVESREKDGLISPTGDYGRAQVNCHTWIKALRLESCEDLLDTHINAWAGVHVLARYQKRYANRDKTACRCGQIPRHHWVAHYNCGHVLKRRGLTYAGAVMHAMRRFIHEAKQGGRQS